MELGLRSQDSFQSNAVRTERQWDCTALFPGPREDPGILWPDTPEAGSCKPFLWVALVLLSCGGGLRLIAMLAMVSVLQALTLCLAWGEALCAGTVHSLAQQPLKRRPSLGPLLSWENCIVEWGARIQSQASPQHEPSPLPCFASVVCFCPKSGEGSFLRLLCEKTLTFPLLNFF